MGWVEWKRGQQLPPGDREGLSSEVGDVRSMPGLLPGPWHGGHGTPVSTEEGQWEWRQRGLWEATYVECQCSQGQSRCALLVVALPWTGTLPTQAP